MPTRRMTSAEAGRAPPRPASAVPVQPPCRALEAAIAGDPAALASFDQYDDPFRLSLTDFVSRARSAVHGL
ncbi:hypothetical protein ACIBBD_33220 [Streptomyces sp. NPDC051315]|uniref:hypothetical protein n=1 Tax=Streptomyces sp. NPDC051315 TaxID=3365650 RepID=UPI00379B8290